MHYNIIYLTVVREELHDRVLITDKNVQLRALKIN